MLKASNNYILNVLKTVRRFLGRVTVTINGESTTYDNNKIIRMNIIEDISILSENLPSNELQLTMDNSEGNFNLLTLENMPSILASKPEIKCELGLEYEITSPTFEGFRYIRDWADGSTSNTSSHWNEIQCWSGTTNRCLGLPVTHNGTMLQDGKNITDGNITTYNSATKKAGGAYIQIDLGQIYNDVDTIKIYHYYADGRTYYGTKTEISSDGQNWVVLRDSQIEGTYKETSEGMTLKPKNKILTTEWVQMGTFILTEWKNDITNKTVTMTGNDYFSLFADLYFEPTTTTSLYSLALDVLTSGGISAERMSIDQALKNITVNPFSERIDIRSALQHIGIAGQCAVFQDREGKIVLEQFSTMDKNENYITFPSTDRQLFGYPSASTYPIIGTGQGMKYIDFDHMYNQPEISLEKNVSQIAIRIYTGTSVEPTLQVYTNPNIIGNSGVSIEIDNPLVNTVALADKIADWYFKETTHNAIYRVRWRQNPILECGDIILIEDSFNFEKQTRIYHQEFLYEGYLEGTTESRGGV